MGIMTDSNVLYLNVSCGSLVNKKKEIRTHGYVGRIISVKEKDDEFEGKPIKRIIVRMKDKEEIAAISFTKDSWYSNGFFARIMNVDFTTPVTMGCSQSDQNEKLSFCWLKQGENTIKKAETFPRPEKGKVGNTEVTDWTGVTQQINIMLPIIEAKIAEANRVKAAAAGASTNPDDLPF